VSPTSVCTSSVGTASATCSARSAASERAEPSSFVSHCRKETFDAGATTWISASFPARARTVGAISAGETFSVARTSTLRGTRTTFPIRTDRKRRHASRPSSVASVKNGCA
jgi:hypothetical protein